MQAVDPNQTLMSLREVLQHAGISQLVLHAWERRYGLAAYQRTAANHRLYTFEQAERLRLLKICSDGGYRIGNIVPLSLVELGVIEEQIVARSRLAPALQLLASVKLEELEVWLLEQVALREVGEFIFTIVSPLMHEVGTLWASTRISIADEHYVTACIKRILLSLFDRLEPARASAPCFIATTPEGELHEIGALCAAVLGRHAGWNAIYLGPSLPVAEIARISERYAAKCICLSITTLTAKRLDDMLAALQLTVVSGTDIIVGGASSQKVPPKDGIIYIKHMSDICGYFSENVK